MGGGVRVANSSGAFSTLIYRDTLSIYTVPNTTQTRLAVLHLFCEEKLTELRKLWAHVGSFAFRTFQETKMLCLKFRNRMLGVVKYGINDVKSSGYSMYHQD